MKPTRTFIATLIALLSAMSQAQVAVPELFNGLHWRLAGPFRGGRALAVTGVPGRPEEFYFGGVGGGVWKTENAGRTWVPIFDKEPVASIGAIAIASSNPEVIYVGSGEADMRSDIQQGDGMYRSSDGGKTWTHIGLEDTRQIGKILVDPKDADTVYVAALGHQYGPNAERGVFKSTDGGKTWSKVLYKNADTGAIELAMDPSDSNVIYAATWQTRRPPWSIYPPSNGPGSGLYKSTDAGVTWTQVRGGGFPAGVGRIGLSISPANPSRIYACIDLADPKKGGMYRSDDGGAIWSHTSGDPRIWGRGWYFMGTTADPTNADQVYVMNTSGYCSVDGGKTFTAFKGAPGGDDYHTCWISPDDSQHMILGSDQGTVVSVDGGKTWSSWYNQPTGQFYHVIADNRFPYWIYGAQQDSGAMAIPSRTIHTGISALYQRPIDAGGESGTIAPDPLHPGQLYSSGGSKEDFETGAEQNTDPTLFRTDEIWRNEWTMPIAISPANPKVVYSSHQKIFRTSDGGASWKVISPDLTRKSTPPLPNLDKPTADDNDGTARRGVVYWIAPSPIRAKQIWAGTDDGLIWLTNDDGLHWKNVTPVTLTPWSKVGIIDASHFDPATAYAAIDRHRIDDNRPFIYRTHDSGKHWKLITEGIPSSQFVNVVREDPRCKGLLYAGTDWGVFVSFDDGGHWQSLQLNLPAASVRDIVFGDGDIVVGTHGRAIWILDHPALLRQRQELLRDTHAILFQPDTAILFQRAGTFGFGLFDEGTPLPPEEPQGENAPWGAIFDYYLWAVTAPVELSISDSKGMLMRRFTSRDQVPVINVNTLSIPAYWVRAGQALSAADGGHRFLWDFRYRTGGGPMAPPGRYTVQMKIGTHVFRQPLVLRRDPRLKATDADLQSQFRFQLEIYGEIDRVQKAMSRAEAMSKEKLSVANQIRLKRIIGPSHPDTSLRYVGDLLERLKGAVGSAPGAPTREFRREFALLRSFANADIQGLKRLRK